MLYAKENCGAERGGVGTTRQELSENLPFQFVILFVVEKSVKIGPRGGCRLFSFYVTCYLQCIIELGVADVADNSYLLGARRGKLGRVLSTLTHRNSRCSTVPPWNASLCYHHRRPHPPQGLRQSGEASDPSESLL